MLLGPSGALIGIRFRLETTVDLNLAFLRHKYFVNISTIIHIQTVFLVNSLAKHVDSRVLNKRVGLNKYVSRQGLF